jgi:heat shock protein HtpX
MKVHGYVTHAAQNRRFTAIFVAGYMLAFQMIAVFALTWFLLIFDEENTVLSNPTGYAFRYSLPVALITAIQFWFLYRGHADAVTRMFGIKLVERADEPRFVNCAEVQCTALGVRLPRFGVIEVDEPNALTVGEGPNKGLIAVTRGLLEKLDDDELAAVLAHEASHIRHGDTKILAANHALMRTAVILQTHNILRLEDWRQLIIPLLIPPILLLFLVSSLATMASIRLARASRRGIRLSRDFIADGEAIRVTHFPEALVSALTKVGGCGNFLDSYRVEGLLFDGPADHEGSTHPSAKDRIDAISSLGAAISQPGRARLDTRSIPTSRPLASSFGRRAASVAGVHRSTGAARMTEVPEKASVALLLLFFSDRERFWRWQNASIDANEWREEDGRNAFGIAPKMVLPLTAVISFLVVLHWPSDGDFTKVAKSMGPSALVDLAREVNSGPNCSGPSYPDGKCH